MNTRHLEFLRLIIETGSFAAAAQAVDVSESAISQAMTTLAEDLGFPLFERKGRRRVATAQAIAVARAGDSVSTALMEVRRAGDSRPTRPAAIRQMNIGVSPAPGYLFAPLIFQGLRRHHPDAQLQILQGRPNDMIDALASGDLDLVITPKPRKFDYPVLSWTVLHTSMPAIYGRIAHPLAGASTLEEIAQAEWAVAGRAGTPSNLVEEAFRVRHWAAPRIAVHCNDHATLLNLVAGTDLLCVISHPVLAAHADQIGVRPIAIREGLPHYEMCLFWSNRNSAANLHWQPVIEALRTELPKEVALIDFAAYAG